MNIFGYQRSFVNMSHLKTDTIAAISTPSGKGGVGIVRISGRDSYSIGKKIAQTELTPRYAHYLNFKSFNDEDLDQGIILYFQAPHSYTGEDIVELQAHGGPIILNLILQTVIEYGARIAKPGEFTERAYLNNKIDLAQAEAIADIINASSEQAAKSAVRSLQGNFSKNINSLVDCLINVRMHVETAIDFSEEEIDFIANDTIKVQLIDIQKKIQSVLHNCKQGVLLREGINIAIVGPPNAGKSSLLNVLSGKESAIVTNIKGTTRDILKEHIQINGIPFNVIDTAGLRISQDIIEIEGIKRAIETIKKSDHIFFVTDFNENKDKHISDCIPEFCNQFPENVPVTFIYNKIDLSNTIPQNHDNYLYISAKSNIGIYALKEYLLKIVGYQQTSEEDIFSARKRHIHALMNAQNNLKTAFIHLQNEDSELLAEELKWAQENIASITGKFNANDLLGEIFSNFCIGK